MQPVTIKKEEGTLARMKNAARRYHLRKAFHNLMTVAAIAIPVYSFLENVVAVPFASYSNLFQNSPQPDGKNIVISTPRDEGFNSISYRLNRRAILRNAKVTYLKDTDSLKELATTVEKVVKDKGTINNLVISAHGNRECIFLGNDSLHEISAVLISFKNTQRKMGMKIANNIVFTGCNIIKDPSFDTLDMIHQSAQNLGAKITLSAEEVITTAFGMSGDFYHFDASGIKGDPSMKAVKTVIDSYLGSKSTDWSKHFEGRSFAEGMTSYKVAFQKSEEAALENKVKLEARRAQITPTISKLYNWKNKGPRA